VRIDGRRIWDIRSIDLAFEEDLPRETLKAKAPTNLPVAPGTVDTKCELYRKLAPPRAHGECFTNAPELLGVISALQARPPGVAP
jgi:hypothetical protein